MPTDASGNYGLPAGYQATTGTTIQTSQHNPIFEDVAAGITARLPRNGSAPMFGPFQAIDGTASAPGIAFASEPTLGFRRQSAGVIQLVGGTMQGLVPIGIGPLPCSLSTAPAGWVLCFGQTLSRTTYAALWTLAQAEISAGNTLYNNGNGTTTFGIADLRGRVPAGKDNMGGTAAGRLTTAGSGVNGATLGASGGGETVTLALTQIPNHDHAVFLNDPGHNHTANDATNKLTQIQQGTSTVTGWSGSGTSGTQSATTGLTISSAAGGGNANKVAATGSGQAHQNCQPTIITNYILYAGA